METLKYTVIKTEKQYIEYCRIFETMVFEDELKYGDEIDLLQLLIEKWNTDNYPFEEPNPVELLKSLMEDHKLKAKDLADILHLSKGTISKILNYQKGFSKETIRKLSAHFKLQQEAFNRPYPLKEDSGKLRTAS